MVGKNNQLHEVTKPVTLNMFSCKIYFQFNGGKHKFVYAGYRTLL